MIENNLIKVLVENIAKNKKTKGIHEIAIPINAPAIAFGKENLKLVLYATIFPPITIVTKFFVM